MGSMKGVVALQALLALAVTSVAGAETLEQKAAVDLARKTLAKKVRSTPDKLELVSVETVDWAGPGVNCGPNRGSEGGPPVSGYEVRLALGVTTFDVRVSEDKAILCGFNPPQSSDATRGDIEPTLSQQADQARSDLAKRLSVAADDIGILEASWVVWRDSSLGCPKPKVGYMQVLTPGFRIRLRSGRGVFAYHGRTGGEPTFCETPSATEPLRAEVE
jgi:hypothetical protein